MPIFFPKRQKLKLRILKISLKPDSIQIRFKSSLYAPHKTEQISNLLKILPMRNPSMPPNVRQQSVRKKFTWTINVRYCCNATSHQLPHTKLQRFSDSNQLHFLRQNAVQMQTLLSNNCKFLRKRRQSDASSSGELQYKFFPSLENSCR